MRAGMRFDINMIRSVCLCIARMVAGMGRRIERRAGWCEGWGIPFVLPAVELLCFYVDAVQGRMGNPVNLLAHMQLQCSVRIDLHGIALDLPLFQNDAAAVFVHAVNSAELVVEQRECSADGRYEIGRIRIEGLALEQIEVGDIVTTTRRSKHHAASKLDGQTVGFHADVLDEHLGLEIL